MAPYSSSADQVGYWDTPTSTIDWCEENYAVTHYVAEFWNSVTNIMLIVPPVIGIIYHSRMGIELRFIALHIALAVVGVGSWLFHMTLKYEMQLMDELPMIFGTSLLTYVIVLQVAYACLVFSFMYKSAEACRKFPILKRCVITSFILFAVAFLIWNIDNVFCGHIRKARGSVSPYVAPFMQLHGWWHIFVGLSCWMHAVITIQARCISTRQPCTMKTLWYIFPYLEFHKKTI